MAISASERPWYETLRLLSRLEAGRRGRTGRMTLRVAAEPLEGRTLLASNWAALANPAPTEIQTMELLTNGTVMAATYSHDWYLLTPSSTGSYVNGTWSELATEPTERLYYGSNVMQDGDLFIVGGEYIGGSSTASDSNTGDIYDPATNSWSTITPFPKSNYGDDPTMLLADGDILAGYLLGPQTYLYNIASNTWTETGNKNNNDRSDEENWVDLPDDSVLSYDITDNTGSEPGLAQRYLPSTGTWVNTGSVPVALSNTSEGELGPNALLPNGEVLQIGGNSNTALFNPATDTNTGGGTWTAGPVIPGGYVSDDAPGVLLPDGQFLFTADLPSYTQPTHVFDYNYTNNTITDITPSTANGDPADLVSQLDDYGSYTDRFLMLPNGQALFTVGADDQLYIYTGPGSVNSSSTPSISGIASNGSNSYTLTGSALNGASEGASYGDDAEMDTNYPIVSVATDIGTTYYADTTDWNKTGVGVTDGATSVNFALPSAIAAPAIVTADALVADSGQALNGVTVATFTDPNGEHTGNYAATIAWGDGTETSGTITGPNGSGVYTVTGSHTYTQDGPETLGVTIVDNYASGQLSVSGSGVSSVPTTFNLSGSGSVTFSVNNAGLATSTGVVSSGNPSTYGQSVTFTATVDNTSGSGGVPTGSVEFFDGTTDVGPGTTLSGSGTIATSTFSIATLKAGAHSIHAVYAGTGGFGGSTGTISQTVNQAVLTVSDITAANKVYDADTTALLSTSSATLVGIISGDTVTLNTGGATGTFVSKDVGTGITVIVAGLTLSGAQAGDYALTQPTMTADITPASLTVSGITAASKVYDASPAATLTTTGATLVGAFAGDTVNLGTGGATGTFASQDVGSGIIVTVGGLTIGGAQEGDYTLTQPTTTASITPASLTVSGFTAANKVYNRNTAATLIATSAALVGVFAGDTVSLNAGGASGTFASQDVGTGITVTVAGLTLGGAQASDYALTQPATTANITPASLTVSGITAANKVYNANATAVLTTSGATLVGVIGGDAVTLKTGGASGTFASQDVGTGITVTIAGLTVSGAQVGNYALGQATTTANITPASLRVTAVTAATKVYDGTTAATLNTGGAVLVGVISGDTVTLITGGASGKFASKDVGTKIAVTASGLTLGGAQGADYALTQPTMKASITPATLMVSGITAANSVYDGSTAATLITTGATLVGVFAGDTVNLGPGAAAGTFASQSVGTGIPVTVTGLTIGGPQVNDYTLTQPTTTGNITPASPTVLVGDSGGPFSGFAFSGTATVAGIVGPAASELEGVAPTPEYFAGSSATGTPLAAAPIDAGTYTVVAVFPGSADYLDGSSAQTTFTIGQATPSVIVSDPTGVYNGSAFDATAVIAGVVGSPDSDLKGVTPTPEYYTGSTANGTPLAAAPVSAGTYTVVATFAGSTDYAADTSQPITFTIGQAAPTVSVSDSGGTYSGSAFKADGTVAGVSGPAVGELEGVAATPEYYVGSSATGTPLTAPPIDAGTYTVVADFAGSTDYLAGNSAPTTFTIARATPTLSLSATGGEFDGSPFAASVAVASGGVNAPAASLEGVVPTLAYYVGSGSSRTSLGSTPPTDAGAYTVVAGFIGSADYAAVQSAPLTFTIGQGIATIALTSSTDSAVHGQAVTFVAHVAAAGTPEGTVTFLANGAAMGTVALDGSGTATLTTSALALGSDSITATYDGDANHVGAQSGSATATVSRSGTSVLLVPNPVLRKKKVVSEVLTAEIAPISPGGGGPTGMVTFEVLTKKKKKIVTKALGTAAVSGGDATLTVKAKPVLGKAITIVYSGDPDFKASTATPPKLSRKGLL